MACPPFPVFAALLPSLLQNCSWLRPSLSCASHIEQHCSLDELLLLLLIFPSPFLCLLKKKWSWIMMMERRRAIEHQPVCWERLERRVAIDPLSLALLVCNSNSSNSDCRHANSVCVWHAFAYLLRMMYCDVLCVRVCVCVTGKQFKDMTVANYSVRLSMMLSCYLFLNTLIDTWFPGPRFCFVKPFQDPTGAPILLSSWIQETRNSCC